MLSLIKWDLRNTWENTKFFNILVGLLLILSILFPQTLINRFVPSLSDLSYIWPIIVSVILFTYILIGMIYTVIKMVLDIRKNEIYLTVDKSSGELIVSRVLVNIILTCILFAIGIVGGYILQRFATDSFSPFALTFETQPLSMILSIVEAGLSLLLAYMVSKSFNFTRNNAFVWTIIFLIVISCGENILDTILQLCCGMQMTYMLTDIQNIGVRCDIANMNIWMYDNLLLILKATLILVYTNICASLLEKRFQR